MVADQYGTPTSAADLADAILAILPRLTEKDAAYGTFHLTIRPDDVERLRPGDFCGPHPTWRPHAPAGGDNHSGLSDPGAAPVMSILDCHKIFNADGIRLRPWQEGVRATLDAMLAGEMEGGAA